MSARSRLPPWRAWPWSGSRAKRRCRCRSSTTWRTHPDHARGARLPERPESVARRHPGRRREERMTAPAATAPPAPPQAEGHPIRIAFTVVIPVYNEEENVRPLLTSLRDVMESSDSRTSSSSSMTARRTPRARGSATWRPSCRLCAWCACGRTSARRPRSPPASTWLSETRHHPRRGRPERSADIPRPVDKLKEGFDVVSGWRHDRQDPLVASSTSRLANSLI